MMRFRHCYGIAFALLLGALPVFAQTSLSATDKEQIRAIIQAQLDAFQADDFDTAFSYASPGIQQRFGSAYNFMVMVTTSYQAVYRPRAVFFQDTVVVRDQVAQKVLFVADDNQSMLGIYPMQRQPDGSWRIDGCYLQPAASQML